MKSIKVELLHRNSLKFISIESKATNHNNHEEETIQQEQQQQQPIWWPGLIFPSFQSMVDTIQHCEELNSYQEEAKEEEELVAKEKIGNQNGKGSYYYVYLLGMNISSSSTASTATTTTTTIVSTSKTSSTIQHRIFKIKSSCINNEKKIKDFITQMEQMAKIYKLQNGWTKALMEALNVYNKIKMNPLMEDNDNNNDDDEIQSHSIISSSKRSSERRIVTLEEHNQFITSLEQYGPLRNGQEWILIANDMIDWTVDDVKSYAYWYMQQLHSIHENDDVSSFYVGEGEGSSGSSSSNNKRGCGGDSDIRMDTQQYHEEKFESTMKVSNNIWTYEENIVFNTLLVLYDSRTQHRWETIASLIPDKVASQCQERWKEIRNQSQ